MLERQPSQTNASSRKANQSTWIYVLIQGLLVGLGGMAHGIFETLQGNVPTGGYLLPFGIFTVLPNYLFTGIAAILAGLSVMIWTVGFMRTRNGPIMFLGLSILLFLVGGGLSQVLFFLLTWAVATRIDKPLAGWRKILAGNPGRNLARFWLPILVCDYLVILIAIGIWLVLSPPSAVTRAPTVTEYVLWSFLGIGILLQPLAIASGFARDIVRADSLDRSRKGSEP